jgi:catechol 2,3-dioxygenase-like lactoylglutathione lyase family enzyme
MSITLNHTIVPARDKEASAKFFADLFGLPYEGHMGPFAVVRINDSLTFDFDERQGQFDWHHYAFHVSEEEFDDIFGRVKGAGIKYGSGPFSSQDMQISNYPGGRRVYFSDPNGHLLELLTRA